MWLQYLLLLPLTPLVVVADGVVGNCLNGTDAYDFVVVGGGTGGLAFASRLSQKRPNDTIVVFEAGGDGRDDQRIYIPWNKGTALGTSLDWNFTTVPQPNVQNRIMPQNRGKVLGGSSAVNLLVWDRGTKTEFDSWEALGNPGWNWNSMYPAELLAEDFLRQNGTDLYGTDGVAQGGPLGTQILQYLSPQAAAFFPVMQSLGAVYNDQSLAGNSLGYGYQPASVNGLTHRRSYSPDYMTLAGPNLCVQVNTRVAKIILTDSPTSKAKGILLANGQAVYAKKEVILAAGAIQSPGLLELSGIGNSTILKSANITPIHDLPGVGEHLQDHMRIQNSYQVAPGVLSSDELRSNATYRAQQLALYNASQPNIYWGSRLSLAWQQWDQVALANASALIALATAAAQADNSSVSNLKLGFLTNSSQSANVPQIELFLSDGYSGRKGYPTDNTTAAYQDGFFTLFASLQHQFSQGSIHVKSSDISVQPKINPNYLSYDYDFQVLLTAAKYLRQIAQTSPLSNYWVAEYEPGTNVQSDADWETYVRNSTFSIYHPTGTCSMLPLDQGGVVDPQLRVWGVDGLRVVDASIIPLLPSGHIQTAVYGIAERAAVFVDQAWK